MHAWYPQAKAGVLVMEGFGTERLVYDPHTGRSRELSLDAVRVLGACSGQRSRAEISVGLQIPPARMTLAVDALTELGLLVPMPVPPAPVIRAGQLKHSAAVAAFATVGGTRPAPAESPAVDGSRTQA